VTTRNLPFYRDPAVLLIDRLKQVYIDGELEEIDTAGQVSTGMATATMKWIS
jgi:peptide/nickel transport system substrate-binding protein